jgi:DNA-binding PadR family transcriptional regulator
MSPTRQINPTTLALTGLLAIRSWTAYELANQMRRALRWAWPRSEANVYSEIKRLVPLGLAGSAEEDNAGRTRTRYQITDDGRTALAEWLRTEPAPVQVQFETLLRVFLADLGSKQELVDTLATTRSQVVQAVEELLPIVEDYAGDAPPFPGRAHLNVLFIHFIATFLRQVLEWCDEAEAEVGTWEGTAGVGLTPGTRRMVEEARAFYRSVATR